MTTSNAKATHVSTLHTFMKYVHFKLTKSQPQLIQKCLYLETYTHGA